MSAEATPEVLPFIRALGAEKAAKLLLAFGGTEVYVPKSPRAGSQLAGVIGVDGIVALGREMGSGVHFRLPLGKKWLVRYLSDRGESTTAIARQLRMTDGSVRRHRAEAPKDGRQLSLI